MTSFGTKQPYNCYIVAWLFEILSIIIFKEKLEIKMDMLKTDAIFPFHLFIGEKHRLPTLNTF